MKETIGDIDILVASNDAHQVIAAFVALPIAKDVGIVTDRDLAIECCTSQTDFRDTEVRNTMTNKPVTAHGDMDINEACKLMAGGQIRRLPVVNNGKLIGIVSLGDLAVCMPHEQAVLDALAGISIPCRVAEQSAAKERATGALMPASA